MKYLLTIIVILIGFSSVSQACRPNINNIKHRLGVYAIQQSFAQKQNSAIDLSGIKVLNTQLFWVETDSAIDCPDKYIIQFELEYKKCFSQFATVSSFKGGKSITFEGKNSCIPDHPED